MNPALLDLDGRVVFVPVRHHSPACARVVRALVGQLHPAAVLVEGPSDFNPRLGELLLPHELPIAIYSYVAGEKGERRGAFYPFCIYSPEWQALQAAREAGAVARFIDLPWSAIAWEADEAANRYADGELRRSRYVAELIRRFGVEDFDALWDTLVEIEPELAPSAYMERVHNFCWHCREMEGGASATDLAREAFMAAEIRRAMDEIPGRILVVTGGFHSSALAAQVLGDPESPPLPPITQRPTDPTTEFEDEFEDEFDAPLAPNAHGPTPPPAQGPTPSESGLALTPYSYERLDGLVGYNAGMPSPGFYHAAWIDREQGRSRTYRGLLAEVAQDLRRRKQSVSSADLIAAESTAVALARLRGHAEVWRTDLVDGVLGALVKDDFVHGVPHPFLLAVQSALRGSARGRLAEGTPVPPLTRDVARLLQDHDLTPAMRERTVEMELDEPEGRERSGLLHRVRVLGIAGFERIGGTDLAARTDIVRLWERWRIRWVPEFDATCIEAAIYGSTVEDAASARLREAAARSERSAERAALLTLDAGLMGLTALAAEFRQELQRLIREDGSFYSVAAALGHLLYLYRYDEALGTAGRGDVGGLLKETFGRALWLLEALGATQGKERALLSGILAIVETFERCGHALEIDLQELVGVLGRVAGDSGRSPTLCGAASGALWALGEKEAGAVFSDVRAWADPNHLGDFLAGLFALAREEAQRHPALLVAIDDLVMASGDRSFLEALPSLRLAFSFFTPREKHHLARSLLEAKGVSNAAPLPDLAVSAEDAARALALEGAVFETIRRYGLRGGEHAETEQ